MRVPALALAALLASLSACRSPQEELDDRRRDYRDAVDALYADYARPPDGAEAPPREPGLLARAFGQADRSWFEGQCVAVGRGERPLSLSGRLETFLDDRRNRGRCEDLARLGRRIEELERKVQAAP